MTEIAFLLLLLVAALAFKNWRHGFALCVLTAILQDPLRKLVPGQPVYFVVFVGVVFVAASLGAMATRVSLAPSQMLGWRQYVGTPFALFVLVALAQAVNSLARFGNPVMTSIGVMSYFAPLSCIALAYRFALSRGEAGVLRWMRFYVVIATLALITVYLEYAGFNSNTLGEVGGGVLISGAGAYYKGNSGIFRAAEIAAWHAATVACFAFVLFWGRRVSLPKLLVAFAFIVFLIGIGALTGRRKMIIEITIFISAYFCLKLWFLRGNGKVVLLTALLGVAGYVGAIGMMQPDRGDGSWASERVSKTTGNSFGKYTERAGTVFEDVPRRIMNTGVQPISWAVAEYGWAGAGLGVGSQGAQHFGGVSSGAAEGGLGKLTVELGVPGLLVAFWFVFALSRYVWRVLGLLAAESPEHANLAFGLVAFMLANVAAFAVATQAYGDLFVLLTLGWSFGFLVALPVLAEAKGIRSQASCAVAPVVYEAPDFSLEEPSCSPS